MDALKKGTDQQTAKSVKKLGFIKLLKREGDRIHIILDPTKYEQPEDKTPAPKTESTSKDTEKNAF